MMISDLRARQIAADWHGGQWTGLYALASSGAIVDGVDNEILDDLNSILTQKGRGQDRQALRALYSYVKSHGLRGPQSHWADLHW